MKRSLVLGTRLCLTVSLLFCRAPDAQAYVQHPIDVYLGVARELETGHHNIHLGEPGDEAFDVVHTKVLTLFLVAHLLLAMQDGSTVNESNIISNALAELTNLQNEIVQQAKKVIASQLSFKGLTQEEALVELSNQVVQLKKWGQREEVVLRSVGIDGYIYQFYQDHDLEPPFPRPPLPQ